MLIIYYIAELLYLQHHTVATIVGDTRMNDYLVTQSTRQLLVLSIYIKTMGYKPKYL